MLLRVKALAGLRSSEWLLIGYFAYVALIAPAFPLPPDVARLPIVVAVLVPALFVALAYGEVNDNPEAFSIARDWFPLGLVLAAYREMDWFSWIPHDHHLELAWVKWDRWLLYGAHLGRAIEALGPIGPGYLEFCYLLVYAVGPFALAVLYFAHRRELANQVVFVYLLGTLLCYVLFPYFPSDPPRTLFGGTDMPNVVTPLRTFNLWLVGGYGIHSSVFPSAHVSSAFSAAWALLFYLREKRRYGWGMLIYAASVAVATIYGRYHYAADAAAGVAASLVAGAAMLRVLERQEKGD